MRSILFAIGLLLLAGGLGWSCQSGDANIGQDIITPNQLDVQFTDTISVFTSTVVVPDTFSTSGDSVLLTGRWRDALAGATNASSYGTPTFTANNLADQTDIAYDSLVLELPYAYVYGDTSQLYTLQAFRLQAPLIAGKVFYNNNAAAYETTPFAQRTFYPRPRSGREAGLVRIRLSDDLGRQLYGKLRDRSITTDDQFRAFLSGLAFTGTSNANLFIGLSVNRSNIALYYHQLATSTTQIALRFGFSAGPHFNHELNDFSGTPLQTLRTRGDRVSSLATNHTTFLTTGPALRTRIDIPALAQVTLNNNYAGVNGAQLVVQPVFKTQLDYFTVGLAFGRSPVIGPGGGLSLYETNDNNEIVSVVPASIGGTTAVSAGYTLNAANPYALDLQDNYVFDLSQYVLQVLRHDRIYRPMLLVYTGPISASLNRLTIGDRYSATDPIRLRLLLTYKK